MIEEILNTVVKAKIMKLFSKFPDSQFQAGEVARMTKLSFSRTNNTLKELAGKGILEYRKKGKGSLFGANKDNYITRIILEAFEKEKGIVDVIAGDFVSRVKSLGKINNITLFGSAVWELNFGSDVDILVIHDGIDEDAVTGVSADLTEKYGFPVICLKMSTEEFKRKLHEGFVVNVMASGRTLFGKSLEGIAYGKGSKNRGS